MNVSLNNRWEGFISRQLEIGRYQNASEVIREGLRLLEEKEMDFELKSAINQGVLSGESKAWDKKAFLKMAHKRADSLDLPE